MKILFFNQNYDSNYCNKGYLKNDFNSQNRLIQDTISFAGIKSNNTNRNIFQKGWDYFMQKDSYSSLKDFNPSCSIMEDEHEYLRQILDFEKNIKPNEIKQFYLKTYNDLSSNKAKSIFRKHFFEYLDEEQSKSNQTATHNRTTNPVNSPYNSSARMQTGSQSSDINCTCQNPNKLPTRVRTADELITQINSMKKEDIPSLVTQISKSTREEQDSLLSAYNSLYKKHSELVENDPLTQLRKNYGPILYDEVASKPENKDKSLAELVKLNELELEKIKKEKGIENIQPETIELGEKVSVLQKQMREQNISFIPLHKGEFKSEEEKTQYLKGSFMMSTNNKASALDAINIYDKYGSRNEYAPSSTLLDDFMTSMCSAIDKIKDTKDKQDVITGTLENFGKYAIRTDDSNDINLLSWFFESHLKSLSKENVLKIINILPNIANNEENIRSIGITIERYAHQMESVPKEDIPEIQQKWNDMKKIIAGNNEE